MKLEFDEIDEDPNLRDTVEELKRRAKESQRIDNKRIHSDLNPKVSAEATPIKRMKTDPK